MKLSWRASPVARSFAKIPGKSKCRDNLFIVSRTDTDEADEFCPYCDNHYVLPAEEPKTTIEAAEFLSSPMLFNDPRMKPNLAEIDAELEALLRE